jgi:hypothetical protein
MSDSFHVPEHRLRRPGSPSGRYKTKPPISVLLINHSGVPGACKGLKAKKQHFSWDFLAGTT